MQFCRLHLPLLLAHLFPYKLLCRRPATPPLRVCSRQSTKQAHSHTQLETNHSRLACCDRNKNSRKKTKREKKTKFTRRKRWWRRTRRRTRRGWRTRTRGLQVLDMARKILLIELCLHSCGSTTGNGRAKHALAGVQIHLHSGISTTVHNLSSLHLGYDSGNSSFQLIGLKSSNISPTQHNTRVTSKQAIHHAVVEHDLLLLLLLLRLL